MSLLGPLSVERFLQEYWQKKSLLVRNATEKYNSALSSDELAGLATESDVDSRIVVQKPDAANWENEDGPFTDQRFEQLPERQWTLLVQSVDQWVPEVAEVLEDFNFLPRWRLDDVMVSYAADGGGVGPHFDYYDVFLLQVSGQREWRLGQHCDEKTPLRVDQPLKLMDNFEQTSIHLLRAGDMLYVPAGTAHWGVAKGNDCMTWSIGFRAPSAAELLVSAAERLAAKLPDSLRYKDVRITSGGSEINESVDAALEHLFRRLEKDHLMAAVKQAFVAQVTEPKYIEAVEPINSGEVESIIEDVSNGCSFVERSPHSRFAYRVLGKVNAQNHEERAEEKAELFVDGIRYRVDLALAKMICEGEIETTGKSAKLIRALLGSGALIAV